MCSQLPSEVIAKWKAGEIFELSLYFNDAIECNGTFFRWVDAGIEYEYPSFYYGDERVFEKCQRQLIEYAQDNLAIINQKGEKL